MIENRERECCKMKADEKKLKTLAITLRWENRYRKGEHLSGDGAFLPELDTLDRDFALALEQHGKRNGKLLEIGAGLGQQAMCYARLGFEVTAVDVSATAMKHARGKAAQQGFPPGSPRFVADNILMSALQDRFDVIADRGCYTTLKNWELEDYCRNVHRLLKPGGLFLLKVNAGQYGMVHSLETHFRIEQSFDTFYHGEPTQGPPAGFFILKPLPA
jgi:SAM-dependent methyltransferase